MRLRISPTPGQSWRTEWPHWLLLALLLLSLSLTPTERVPIHWNVDGKVDGFAPRWLALVLAVGIYLLLLVLPRLDPGPANYAQFAGVYGVIRLAVLAVLVVLIGIGALGLRAQGLPHLLVGALLLLVGSVLGKIRPNWFAGIRLLAAGFVDHELAELGEDGSAGLGDDGGS